MPERRCFGCDKREEWGCEAKKLRPAGPGEAEIATWEKPAALPLDLDGEEVYACPRQDIRENPLWWRQVLKYYSMYNKGFLPQPGAVMDQSNKAVELFQILDDINAECDNQKMEADARTKGDPFKDRGSSHGDQQR